MAVYAIGDLQGCFEPLKSLLRKIKFKSDRDVLWFAGDLVNRGKQSLACLRFVRDLGDNAVTVLGNHDLHLLAVAEGLRNDKRHDFDEVFNAPDREQLLHWLRCRPLFHFDRNLNFALFHAGLPPQWDLDTAQRCAMELHATLHDEGYRGFLRHMYGNEPDLWSDDLTGWERLRFICNCFTRLRYCDREGRLALECSSAPGTQPEGQVPWFEHPDRQTTGIRLTFGHWSTLGAYHTDNIYALDSGCVWGGQLSALKIDDPSPRYVQVKCEGSLRPGED